jgi:glycosyltransferase involved in cell wall biosynthesis
MKLLINTSNLKKGGAIQVALSFLKECICFQENEYYVLLSYELSIQIYQIEYPKNFHFNIINKSPSSLIYGLFSIYKVKKFENQIKPDCVITVFGPSYWTPKSPHILGFAQGYYLYPESQFLKGIKLINRIKISFLKALHRYFFTRNGRYYYVESEDAKYRLAKFLNRNENFIHAISNTYHSVYKSQLNGSLILPPKQKNEIRLVTISSYYKHKNLEIINDVISELKNRSKLKYIFILTIDQAIFKSKFKAFRDNIINLGPVPIELCPKIYQECDFLFLPTLIEIFSASYPEAMIMQKPILTSDLSFAHDLCGQAAEYFDPLNSKDIANKIIYVTNTKERQNELIKKGIEKLLEFETPNSRAIKLLDICKKISRKSICSIE